MVSYHKQNARRKQLDKKNTKTLKEYKKKKAFKNETGQLCGKSSIGIFM